MGQSQTENFFRAIVGFLATSGAFALSAGNSFAIGALASVGAATAINIGSEQMIYFIRNAISSISESKIINEHLERAMHEAISNATNDIKNEWFESKNQLDRNSKDKISNFLDHIIKITKHYFSTKSKLKIEDIFEIIEIGNQNGEVVLEKLLKYKYNTKYWKDIFFISDEFIDFFEKSFYDKFNYYYRIEIKKGKEAKNALDILYYQTFREQLKYLLNNNDKILLNLEIITKTISTLASSHSTNQTETLKKWIDNAIKKSLKEFQDHLLEYVNKQPNLEFDYRKQKDNNVIFRQRSVEYVWREDVKSELFNFYSKESPLEWWVITGDAGTGKSRLALEFCIWLHESLSYPVSAGFMSEENFDNYNWTNDPVRPWFIVIDYAASREEKIKSVMEHLRAKESNGKLNHKVRLLLLERKVPSNWWETALDKTQKLRFSIDGGNITPYKIIPLSLNIEKSGIRKRYAQKILKNCLLNFGISLSNEEISSHLLTIYTIDISLRPLFLLFSARAIADGNILHEWQKSDLMQYWLLNHEHRRWKHYLITEGKEEKDLALFLNLLALITMLYGANQNEIELIYSTYNDYLPHPPYEAQRIYENYFAQLEIDKWYPLEPDVYGEFFVKNHLVVNKTGFERKEQEQRRNTLISIAWHTNSARMKGFVIRYFQDYGDDDLLSSFINQKLRSSDILLDWCYTVAYIIEFYANKTEYVMAEKYENLLWSHTENKNLPPSGVAICIFISIELYLNQNKYELAEVKYNQLVMLEATNQNDHGVAIRLSEVTYNFINAYGSKGMIKYFERAEKKFINLMSMAEKYHDISDVIIPIAKSAYNLITDYGSIRTPDFLLLAEKKYSELLSLKSKCRSISDVDLLIAKAAFNLINFYGSNDTEVYQDMIKTKYSDLKAVVSKNIENPEMILILCEGIVNAIYYFGSNIGHSDLVLAEEMYLELYTFAKQHQEIPAVATQLAKGTFHLIIDYVSKGTEYYLQLAEKKYLIIDELTKRNEDLPEVVILQAKGAENLLFYYTSKRSEIYTRQVKQKLADIVTLTNRHNDIPDVVIRFANVAVNAICYYCAKGGSANLILAENIYIDLYSLSERHTNLAEVTIQVARGALNLIIHYGSNGTPSDIFSAENKHRQLTDLAEKYSHIHEIIILLAEGIVNLIIDYASKGTDEDYLLAENKYSELYLLALHHKNISEVAIRFAEGTLKLINYYLSKDTNSALEVSNQKYTVLCEFTLKNMDIPEVAIHLAQGTLNFIYYYASKVTESSLELANVKYKQLFSLTTQHSENLLVAIRFAKSIKFLAYGYICINHTEKVRIIIKDLIILNKIYGGDKQILCINFTTVLLIFENFTNRGLFLQGIEICELICGYDFTLIDDDQLVKLSILCKYFIETFNPIFFEKSNVSYNQQRINLLKLISRLNILVRNSTVWDNSHWAMVMLSKL